VITDVKHYIQCRKGFLIKVLTLLKQQAAFATLAHSNSRVKNTWYQGSSSTISLGKKPSKLEVQRRIIQTSPELQTGLL
jgi:hypothetical protein